jgi:hypothetical protein
LERGRDGRQLERARELMISWRPVFTVYCNACFAIYINPYSSHDLNCILLNSR